MRSLIVLTSCEYKLERSRFQASLYFPNNLPKILMTALSSIEYCFLFRIVMKRILIKRIQSITALFINFYRYFIENS